MYVCFVYILHCLWHVLLIQSIGYGIFYQGYILSSNCRSIVSSFCSWFNLTFIRLFVQKLFSRRLEIQTKKSDTIFLFRFSLLCFIEIGDAYHFVLFGRFKHSQLKMFLCVCSEYIE